MHIWYCYKCVVSNTAFQQPQTQYSIFTVTSIFLPTVQGFLQDSPFIVHMHVKVHSTDTWVPSIPCIRMYAYSHIGMIDLAYIGLYMSFCISFWCGQKVAIMIQTRKIGRYKNKKEMLAILTRKQNVVTCMAINYDTVEQYCTLWRCDKTFFVLAYTPPPGLTTCHECPRSSPAHWLSRLSVGSGSAWTHTRTAPETPESETPSLPHRSARTSSQWWDCLECRQLSIWCLWCWRWHTTDQWAAPGVAWAQIPNTDQWGACPWVVRGAWAQMNSGHCHDKQTRRRSICKNKESFITPPQCTILFHCIIIDSHASNNVLLSCKYS